MHRVGQRAVDRQTLLAQHGGIGARGVGKQGSFASYLPIKQDTNLFIN
jgi:hypothetical protein